MFWRSTIGEVIDLIESEARIQKRKQEERLAAVKDEINLLFVQALQIGNVIGHDNDTPIMTPADYYPDLFKEDAVEERSGDKMSPEMELYKAKMSDYAWRHNKELEKERGKGDGRNDP